MRRPIASSRCVLAPAAAATGRHGILWTARAFIPAGRAFGTGGDDDGRGQSPEGPRRRGPQDRRKARGMEHAGPTSGDARPRGPTTTEDAGTGSGSRLGPRGQNRASARARRAEQLLASGYTARLTALAWMEGSWSTPTGTARCGRTVAFALGGRGSTYGWKQIRSARKRIRIAPFTTFELGYESSRIQIQNECHGFGFAFGYLRR
jgi:hypothetical protein